MENTKRLINKSNAQRKCQCFENLIRNNGIQRTILKANIKGKSHMDEKYQRLDQNELQRMCTDGRR